MYDSFLLWLRNHSRPMSAARLLKRYDPSLNPAACIETVRNELQNYPGATFAGFLTFDGIAIDARRICEEFSV